MTWGLRFLICVIVCEITLAIVLVAITVGTKFEEYTRPTPPPTCIATDGQPASCQHTW